MTRRMMIAGNWKMNGLEASLDFFSHNDLTRDLPGMDRVICPPATLLRAAHHAASRCGIDVGGQDCHGQESGAHTGDISAEMVADCGARYVIVGHSERRANHAESSAMVKDKAQAALRAGLTPILCVGETQGERESGQAESVVGRQLADSWPQDAADTDLVIAYEPVWAIGTGLTASLDDIAAMHGFIRAQRPGGADLRILYGGSVKPGNAADILSLSDVDGALIGGASLTAESFAAIVDSAPD